MEEPDNPFAPTQTVVEVPRNQDDKERLYDYIDTLRDWQQHTVEWIFSVLGADGRELFCHHACVVLQQKEPTSNSKDVALEVWERMPEDQRQVWAEKTPQMLLEGTRGFEDLLSTNDTSKMASELRTVAERACEYFERISAEEKKKKEREAQKVARRLEKSAQNMQGRLQLLHAASDPPGEGNGGKETLMRQFDTVDAKSMFFYHALPFLAQKLEGSTATSKIEAVVLEMWNLLKGDRQFWEKMASRFLMAAEHKAAKYLAATRSIRQLEISYGRYQKQQQRKMAAIFASRPVLAALVGSRVRDCSDKELIPKILHGIQDRVTTNAALTLHGRVQSARICYSPSEMGVTGIGARLRVLSMRQGTAAQYEALLQPLANWNLDYFPEISDAVRDALAEVVSKPNKYSYRSQWLHHRKCYDSIAPISRRNASEVVAAVVRSVRQRCELVNPGSLLLLPLEEVLLANQESVEEAQKLSQAKLRKWSLHSPSEGFGAQVMRCFGKEGSPEEYEDRIETVLYRFKMKCPAAVFGREDDGLEAL